MYSTLIRSALEVITKKVVHPYTIVSCQEMLFDALVAFYEESSLSILPNINVALDILTKARNSKNLKISSVCERGLSFLEILCQPVCPSLYSSENSSQQQLDVSEKIPEELRQIDASSDDKNSITNGVNNENNSLENPVITDTNSNEFNDENIVEPFIETIVEEDTQSREAVRENSVQILDVKILKPSLSSDISESTPKIATPEVQTGKFSLKVFVYVVENRI